MGKLSALKPNRVFQIFEEICAIPHGSYDMDRISEYLVNFAEERNLEVYKDEAKNVFIKAPYSGDDYKDSAPVLLQGHMDMVCEKSPQSRHNFKTDPLPIDFMDDDIFARSTTLGADDGIALAYMLALLDTDCPHPPLELLFTTDEEIGMDGVKAFDFSRVSAKRVINLDSEDEGIFFVSCAGGMRSRLSVPVKRYESSGIRYNIIISGLNGGHSGDMIDRYNANAIILMGRLLHYLGKKHKFSIINLQGGLMDNAIPREANCHILISKSRSKDFEKLIAEFEKTIKNEFSANEKNMMIYCENLGQTTETVLKPRLQERVIFLLNTIPDGVQNMCMDGNQKGLVKTSLNFGIMRLHDDCFTLEAGLRSSVSSEKYALSDKLRYLTESIGGSYTESGDYPAWEYNESSELLRVVTGVYKKQSGKDPVVKGIHAGLECGVIYHNLKPVDIISLGPDIKDAHTTKERLSVSSTQRTWELLLELLKELK